MKKGNLIAVTVLCCCLVSMSFGAETVHLTLIGEYEQWIRGDSMQTSLGREGTIEVLAYTHMLAAEPDPRNGITGGVQNHFPVTILKRLDRSTPLLFQAWQTHEACTATFRFFRPNPTGDGTTQQFYTVVLRGAYIAGIRQEVPSTIDPATAQYPPVERVSFTYSEITEIWADGGIEYGAEWRHNTAAKIPLSDVNFDGIVNMKDFVILADDWMTQY